MAKRSKSPQDGQPVVTRKFLSRAEREARERQRVIIGSTILAALVALILLGGAIYSYVYAPRQPIAKVGGDEVITRGEFYQRVNYERFRIFLTIQDVKERFNEYMSDEQSAQFFGQMFQQQFGQLQQVYARVGLQTLEQMIEERVIEKKAAERGITVSEEEIDTEIRRQMAQLEGAQIEADVTATAEANVAATATAEQFTPTPTEEPTATPEATEVITPTDTLTGTGSITSTDTLTDTPPATQEPMPTPTPNILTDDRFGESYTAFLNDLSNRVGYDEADFRRVVRYKLLREKLSEAVIAEADVSTTEKQIHAAHILVETEEEAKKVRERLEGGEEFAKLAEELSTDEANAKSGGDLGWFGRDRMAPPFEEAAFALSEPGDISEPVETQFGWHVIKLIEGPEEREVAEFTLRQREQEAFRKYLQDGKTEMSVERFWTAEDLPSDPFVDEIRANLPEIPQGQQPPQAPAPTN